jgi:hypothetical protein
LDRLVVCDIDQNWMNQIAKLRYQLIGILYATNSCHDLCANVCSIGQSTNRSIDAWIKRGREHKYHQALLGEVDCKQSAKAR